MAIAVRQRATLREARRAFEQRYVAKVMDKCDGNRERVIAWLGISRSSLKEKLADGRED